MRIGLHILITCSLLLVCFGCVAYVDRSPYDYSYSNYYSYPEYPSYNYGYPGYYLPPLYFNYSDHGPYRHYRRW